MDIEEIYIVKDVLDLIGEYKDGLDIAILKEDLNDEMQLYNMYPSENNYCPSFLKYWLKLDRELYPEVAQRKRKRYLL